MGRRYLRGEKSIGIKLGFTSKAKMEQMGVHDLIWGQLTSAMQHAAGSSIDSKNYIHPRAEPEIAFLLSKQLNNDVTLDNVQEYVKGVAIAIEIIDSRFQNFQFSLEDVVADNCSSTALTIGEWFLPKTKITDLKMTLKIDGELVKEGNSNAILGNPWESVVNAGRLASSNGLMLKENDVLLGGAATAATFIKKGHTVEAFAEGLGSVNLIMA